MLNSEQCICGHPKNWHVIAGHCNCGCMQFRNQIKEYHEIICKCGHPFLVHDDETGHCFEGEVYIDDNNSKCWEPCSCHEFREEVI